MCMLGSNIYQPNTFSKEKSMNYNGQNKFDIDELFKHLQNQKDSIITQENNIVRIEVASDKSLYFFTLPQHPVHASVVIRKVLEEDGKIKIKTSGHTTADRHLFEKWLINLKKTDWKIKNNLV